MSFLGDIFSASGDLATSILDRAPGGGWVRAAYDRGQTWILAAAKSPVGGWMMDVITNSVGIPALLPIVGPAATALWAVPGLAKGEPFSQAYVEGFSKRLVQLAQYLAGQGASEALQKQAADAMSSQVQQISQDPAVQGALSQIAREQTTQAIRDALVQAHMTPEEIAARFGARPDAAAIALNALLHQQVFDPNEFQIPDGQHPIPVRDLGTEPLQSSGTYMTALNLARANLMSLQKATGVPGSENRIRSGQLDVQRFTQLYETALSQENQTKDATYWLTQLLTAQKSGAPPDQIAAFQKKYDDAIRLEQGGLSFRFGPPISESYGKPDASQVMLDVGVLVGALWVLSRFGRR